jgi:hypothetical protein
VVVGDLTVTPPGTNANARAVRDLAVSLRPAAIVLAGDLVHPASSLSQLTSTFDSVWGDQWQRIAPAIGNHDYNLGHSSGWASTGGGYFDYFGGNGGRARPANASYYSFNVVVPQGGHWHVIVLNSACGDYSNPPAWVTPSGALTGAMANWLRADLAADDALGELVVFHEPAFASRAPHGGKAEMRNLWWTMELRGVDLVVCGHNHPMSASPSKTTPAGAPPPASARSSSGPAAPR